MSHRRYASRSPNLLLAGLLVAMIALSGCAVSQPAQPRSIAVQASADETLKATLSMLAERGFVIRHGDGDLGQIDAVLASRSGYEVHAQITTGGERPAGLVMQNGDTYLTLSGRRGGQPLDALSLDPLFIDVQNRLGLLP